MKRTALPAGVEKPIPKCFISYQSRSRQWAKHLKGHLVSAGCKAWFDDDEILAGHPVISEIIRGIQESDVFLLIWNKAANKSVWVSDEILRALHKKAASRNGYLIIVLRRDNTPLPQGLQEYKWLNVTSPREYPKILKAILDSIADNFGGYVFTAILPDRSVPEYRLQWTRANSNSKGEEETTPYQTTLSVWDIQTGKLIASSDTGSETGSVETVNNELIITGIFLGGETDDPDEHDIIIAKVGNLEKIKGIRLFGGEDHPWCIRKSPDEKRFAITGGSHGGKLFICDCNLNILCNPKVNAGLSITWIGPTNVVVSAQSGHNEDKLVRMDILSSEILDELPCIPNHISKISSDTKGRYVVCSGGNWEGGPGVLIIDLTSNSILHQFRSGHFIGASCISPNGKYVAWSDIDDRHISIAELPSGKKLRTFLSHARPISTLRFDDESRYLASGCNGGFVLVWKLPDIERVAKFKVGNGIQDIVFAKDARYLVVGNMHPDVPIID